jgi:type VII secretion protein EccB
MQSRKDQVQAYFFVVGRLVAAVTHGHPDALTTPNRRTATGTVLGVLLALLLVAVFFILGLFIPGGNNAWRKPGAIVLDSDSGARYVYLDGQLRPALNYVSARLASGNNEPLVSVSAGSLTGAPVGQPIGIPGAPDGVPTAARLDTGAWTVCVGPSGAATPVVSVLMGRSPGAALDGNQALLVSTPDGARHLVWQGSRHRITDPAASTVLGYGRATALPVSTSWLNPIPPGRDLGVPPTPRAGEPGPPVDGRPSRIGQVFEQRDAALDTEAFYLLRPDGLAALSPTSAALALASPSAAKAYPDSVPAPIPIAPGAVSRLPSSRSADLVDGLPVRPPQVMIPPNGAVPCVRYVPARDGPPMAVPEVRPTADAVAGAGAGGPPPAGPNPPHLSIPAGSGALVRGGPGGPVFLVTDNGNRFPLVGDDVLGRLGYSPGTVVPLSQELVDLLPAGTPLSTADALRTSP